MDNLGDESNDDEEGDNGGGVSSSGDEFSWRVETFILLPTGESLVNCHPQKQVSKLSMFSK